METIMINKEQLELLRDPKNMPLLQLLMTPHTPSKAAKHFGLSANALHYRFKKLSEVIDENIRLLLIISKLTKL
jgi:hypothetical protein